MREHRQLVELIADSVEQPFGDCEVCGHTICSSCVECHSCGDVP